MNHSLYLSDLSTVTSDDVRAFLQGLLDENLLTENLTVELKARRDKENVAEAICAMANGQGGLVFLGVDERTVPLLGGVEPAERDSLVRQLGSVLEPDVMPEMTSVVADDISKIVLVIRVEPDSAAVPVLCRGRAFVRQPGQTSRATRAQLLELSARASAGPSNVWPLHQSLLSQFTPQGRVGSGDEGQIPALRMRAAGGLQVRAEPAAQLTVGTELRRHLERLIDGSPLAIWTGGHLPPQATTHWQPVAARHSLWEAQRAVTRRFPPDVALSLHTRADGRRITYFVDVEIRFKSEEDETESLIALEDVADGALRLLELVDEELPDAVCTVLGLPPLVQERTTLWLTPADHDLHRLLGLDRFAHDVDEQRVHAAQLDVHRYGVIERRDALEHWLSTMLLDDGVRDAELIARKVRAEIPLIVDPKPWLRR